MFRDKPKTSTWKSCLQKFAAAVQVDAYDTLLVGYQKAAVNTEAIASVLNAGQGTILAVGLTGVLAVAAASAGVGTFTAGDLVSINQASLPILLK